MASSHTFLVNELRCPPNDTITDDTENAQVCGTDNQTYSSICSLLQRTTNVQVAHAGPCEDPRCRGGPVGTDPYTHTHTHTYTLYYTLGILL